MRNLIFLLAVAFFAAGCSTVQKQAFNAAANPHVQRIAVVNPPKVKETVVYMLTHPGSSFGLVGGLIAAADTAMKTEKYNKATGAVDWDQYAMQQIRSELGRAGYRVSSVDLRGEKDTKRDLLKKYPEIPADAVLDFYYGVAHVASGATTNYVPSVKLKARLTDLKDQSVLYEEQFSAGLATNKDDTHLALSSKEYANISLLVANAGEGANSLRAGIRAIAKRLASDLAKK